MRRKNETECVFPPVCSRCNGNWPQPSQTGHHSDNCSQLGTLMAWQLVTACEQVSFSGSGGKETAVREKVNRLPFPWSGPTPCPCGHAAPAATASRQTNEPFPSSSNLSSLHPSPARAAAGSGQQDLIGSPRAHSASGVRARENCRGGSPPPPPPPPPLSLISREIELPRRPH